ncbi:CPBP family intramembrane glutamic endopeptidase [Neolewinella litorea]|uniref:CPBP family intramembrane metalloprotease n=1 Tax=Neolewinella litorea TaxID=2562452 RepID=A0A4S4P0J7_9BACT|nr:type II CAAX endopeptidase family protein [Neolewinella litorea]THH42080.1 CPBP family intramembrane metalloprotease [Neolewinella litorea]
MTWKNYLSLALIILVYILTEEARALLISILEIQDTLVQNLLFQFLTLGGIVVTLFSFHQPFEKEWAQIGPQPKLYLWALAGTFLLSAATATVAKIIFGDASLNSIPPDHNSMLLSFLSVVIVAPVLEEILFRLFIFNNVSAIFNSSISILLTSLLFAGLHGVGKYALAVLGMSFATTYVYARTRSLRLAISIHAFFNLLGWMSTLSRGTSARHDLEFPAEFAIVANSALALAFVVLGWLILKNKVQPFRPSDGCVGFNSKTG